LVSLSVIESLARKLVKEIRYPEIAGKVCRALPYERDIKKYDSKACLFIKGLEKSWTHKDFYEYMSRFGEVASAKVSISDNYISRGYGFVLFSKEEFAAQALACVIEKVLIFNSLMASNSPKKVS
jgi:RNA recognition motif-containing protein